MLLAVAVLILCLLIVLTVIATLSNAAVIVIACVAAGFTIAYMLGFGPAVGHRRPTTYS